MIGLAASIGDSCVADSWIGVSLAIARQRQCGGSLLTGGRMSPPRRAIIQDDEGKLVPVTSLCGPELTGEKCVNGALQREATGPSIFTQARASRRTVS